MDIQKFPLREFDLEFGEGGERAGAGGGVFFSWLCSVVFLFEGAGGDGFLVNWLCSVVFVS